MKNLIMALSNLPALVPLYIIFCNKEDYTTGIILSLAVIASFISHLLENHKHGMIGYYDVSSMTSYIWNKLDVIFANMVFLRIGYLYFNIYGFYIYDPHMIVNFLLIFLIGIFSEYDKYNPNLRNIYMIMHITWHCGIYILLAIFIHYYL